MLPVSPHRPRRIRRPRLVPVDQPSASLRAPAPRRGRRTTASRSQNSGAASTCDARDRERRERAQQRRHAARAVVARDRDVRPIAEDRRRRAASAPAPARSRRTPARRRRTSPRSRCANRTGCATCSASSSRIASGSLGIRRRGHVRRTPGRCGARSSIAASTSRERVAAHRRRPGCGTRTRPGCVFAASPAAAHQHERHRRSRPCAPDSTHCFARVVVRDHHAVAARDERRDHARRPPTTAAIVPGSRARRRRGSPRRAPR